MLIKGLSEKKEKRRKKKRELRYCIHFSDLTHGEKRSSLPSQTSHNSRGLVLDESLGSAPQHFLMVLSTKAPVGFALPPDASLFLCPNEFACSLPDPGLCHPWLNREHPEKRSARNCDAADGEVLPRRARTPSPCCSLLKKPSKFLE